MDVTGSMGSYLDQANATIKKIIDDFTVRSEIRHIKSRFGFVGYRDHPPEEKTFVTRVKDFCDFKTLRKFIRKQSANGGGDFAEAVFDGLKDSVVKCSWNDNPAHETLRYIIHNADAPPHGKEFNNSGHHDRWPEGNPLGITLKELGRLFYQNNIRYRLYKIDNPGLFSKGGNLDLMDKKFKAMFHDMRSVNITDAQQMKLEVSKGLIQEIMFTKE